MLLLHISDIHFRYPFCETDFDPDRPFRTLLLNDVRQQVQILGPVAAILVGGDIAYHGISAEYDAAWSWLSELAQACHCRLERVFVVPGNHDVDRDVIRNDERVREVQNAVANAPNGKVRERELSKYLFDPSSSLFAPMAAYNSFAAKLSCQVYPKKPSWKQEINIDEHTKLVIHGVTSTFLSGIGAPEGVDDIQGKLYLSPFQTVLDPLDNVVNLVLCHHPPDWLVDCDEVEDAVRGRASLQMFGHRHRQRIYRDDHYVRFAAAAVNPDRHEQGWEPGYNFIRLAVSINEGRRYLDVQAWLRRWQTDPDRFVAKLTADDKQIFTKRLPVRGPINAGEAAVHPAGAIVNENIETAMSETSTRNLVLRFWKLSSSKRRDIALKLKLIDASELGVSEPERYSRALMRAGERGLLDKLAEEIERTEGGDGRKSN
jgi:hypothetical protein